MHKQGNDQKVLGLLRTEMSLFFFHILYGQIKEHIHFMFFNLEIYLRL